jgi:hypothetical protein
VAAIAHHPVAGFERGHLAAAARHGSCEFAGGREGKVRLDLVLAGDQQRVEEIQRGGRDAHENLVLARLRLRQRAQFEVVGRAVAAAQDGSHRRSGRVAARML